MVANCDPHRPLRRMLIAASALAVGFSLSAAAQTAPAMDNSAAGQNFSSSTDYRAYLSTDALFGGSSYAEPAAGASASPQYGGGRGSSYPSYENKWSHLAFEGGFGFAAPIGNDTSFSQADVDAGYLSPSLGWGWDVNAGVGWNFSKKFGVLLEYGFDRQGMNNDYLNAVSTVQAGGSVSTTGLGGNVNTWDFVVEPIYYLPVSHKNGAYVTGGGGFYRKVTNFTEPVEEESYYGIYSVPATVDHFSSNQGGGNFGVGVYHKLSEDSNAKFFAEIRYVFVDSPVASSSNSYQGSGTQEIIPVNFGIRF
jgi:hypothetical protein